MRIDSRQNNISFNRALTPGEEKAYTKVLQQAKEVIGQTGNSILIMPSASLPQTAGFNSGTGHLSSDIARDYLKYMQTYYGINVVQDLPAGQVHNINNFYCAYEGSALELGVHEINPELLATDEFAHLLSADDLKRISDGNTSEIKEEFANFKNVIDKGSETDKALTKAFEKFKTLSETSPLKVKYKKFVSENADWLEFPREHEPNQEFFKFKQFLADEHLKIGKSKVNAMGIKVAGDCTIGFSQDEIKAFPDAFYRDKILKIGEWKTRALNYDEITNPQSAAYKLLKRKVQLAARRYDIIRMDVGWAYVTPKLTTHTGDVVKPQMNSRLIELIEKWVKEVKGEFFDTNKILYEVEAGKDDFNAFVNNTLISPLKNRMKIYTSLYMHDDGIFDRWGYAKAFAEKGLTYDEFVLGLGNHDSQPLKQIAKGIADRYMPEINQRDHKTAAIKVLSKLFHIPERVLADPVEFAKAKFAEPLMAKHNMVFFADVFGLEEAFNKHAENKITTPERNFALKIPADFKKKLHEAIQEGYGFNIMDSLEKVFRANGYDRTHASLFKKIVHFKEVLNSTQENVFRLTKGKLITFGLLGGAIGILGAILFNKKQNKDNETAKNQSEPQQIISTPSVKIDDLLIKKV